MKQLILCMLLSIHCISSSLAAVLTFDDIATDQTGLIPDGYGHSDFIWGESEDGSSRGGLAYIHYSRHPGSGYDLGRVSGEYVGFEGWGSASFLTLESGTFDFNGAFITAAWWDDLQVVLEGYQNDTLLYSTTVTVNPTNPQWFDFNFNRINRLSFHSFGGSGYDPNNLGNGNMFAFDNFTYELNAVPVPAAVWLFGSGLIGLIGFAKRKDNA